jgi:hypothetical protein
MGDALDFDAEADKLAKGQKVAKKARKPRAVKTDKPAKAPRKKRAPKTLAYLVLGDRPADPLAPVPQGVMGPFTDSSEMIAHMHDNSVAEGYHVVVFREVRRGPVKTKTWIG